MRERPQDLGVGDTFRPTPVGVFFGMPGVRVPDPYFGGAGPARTGCTECGDCMIGCRVGAKNTLVKNYLALAERLGATIEPLRTVVDVRPLPGSAAYRVTTEATGAWLRKDRRTVTAEQVVFAAGAWGTQRLLHTLRDSGALPRLSDRLGHLTRTNSEALGGATLEHVPPGSTSPGASPSPRRSTPTTTPTSRPSATARAPTPWGPLARSWSTAAGRSRARVRFLVDAARHPVVFVRSLSQYRWSERTVIALVMQTRDNSLTVSSRRGLLGGRVLTSRQGHGEPNPTWIPAGHRALVAARGASCAGDRAARLPGQLHRRGRRRADDRPLPRRRGHRRPTGPAASSTPTTGCAATPACTWSTARRSRPTSGSTRR